MTSAKETRQSRRLEEHTYGTSPCRAGRFGLQPPPAHVAGSLAPDTCGTRKDAPCGAGNRHDVTTVLKFALSTLTTKHLKVRNTHHLILVLYRDILVVPVYWYF